MESAFLHLNDTEIFCNTRKNLSKFYNHTRLIFMPAEILVYGKWYFYRELFVASRYTL